MGAVWALVFCMLTVWLSKGSSLPVGGPSEGLDGLQRRIRDVSPNDIAIKKALALLQSMEAMLEHNAKEVQLETNEVEAEASVGHLKLVQQTGPKDDSYSHTASGSVTPPASYHNVTVASDYEGANATVASDYEGANATAASDYEGANATAASDYEGANATAASDYEAANATAASDYEGANATAASDYEGANATAASDYEGANATAASDHGAVNEVTEMGPDGGRAVTKIIRVGAETPKLITNSYSETM